MCSTVESWYSVLCKITTSGSSSSTTCPGLLLCFLSTTLRHIPSATGRRTHSLYLLISITDITNPTWRGYWGPGVSKVEPVTGKEILVICSNMQFLTKKSSYEYTHTFNCLFPRTTWVSWHQKGKPFWIFLKQEMGWQWHQLDDHMQIICTTLQTDNHASTLSLNFLTPNQQCQSSEGSNFSSQMSSGTRRKFRFGDTSGGETFDLGAWTPLPPSLELP